MKKIFIPFVVSTLLSMLFTGRLNAQNTFTSPLEFHGYTQLRFTSDFSDTHSFSLRRLKLWIVPKTNRSKHWDFKIQSTFTSNRNEAFFLQDVMLRYKSGAFQIKLGQFTPEYSLERFEHDYSIPLAERSIVVDRLIPNATTGVRDIGLEGSYKAPSGIFTTWFGIFNGYGIKEYRLNNNGIMMTHKTSFNILKGYWTAGYSLMYRKADHLNLLKVLPENEFFTGNEFRFNLFSKIQFTPLSFQAEYFYANLNHRHADGYYFMGIWKKKNQSIAASYNQYTDLIDTTTNDPEIHLAYSWLFRGDKIKLILDNGVKTRYRSVYDYYLIVQFQFFFY